MPAKVSRYKPALSTGRTARFEHAGPQHISVGRTNEGLPEMPRHPQSVESEDEEPRPEDLQKEEELEKAKEAQEVGEAELSGETEAAEPVAVRSLELLSDDGETTIRLYLREIGQVKLLTPQEEIELALRIQKGDKRAREQMIKANLRLVVRIARDYEGIGLPLLDLISEGNIGLMKAVERFDPAKGSKLSTYAVWWIKQYIKRALANQSRTIRLPVHLVDKIFRMRRTGLRLQEELGREPSDEELGEELGITTSYVAKMRMASIRPASLDAPMGEEDSMTLAETVPDSNAASPDRQLEERSGTWMLQDMLKTLSPREVVIIRDRFGLDGASPKSLQEIGDVLGLTRERVRQLQIAALEKLRTMIERMDAMQERMTGQETGAK